MTSLISVLMTARDEERFLPAALDSLLTQTCTSFELIVVNDGSTDKTKEILDQYASRDTRIYPHHQPKSGRASSLNTAFHLARGDFIAIMDSDDLSLPNRLARQLAYMESNSHIGLVGSYYEQIDGRDQTIKTVDRVPCEPDAVRAMLLTDNPICHGTVFVRRHVMEQAGLYREAFPASLDYDLYLRVLDKQSIAIIPEVLYRYRIHGKSISSRRLLQLQMKRLAQVLQRQRSDSGVDALQKASTLAEQQAYIEAFLKEDHRANRLVYSGQLFEMGKKYYRLGEYEAAFRLFKTALQLDPTRLKALRYLGKAYFKDLKAEY